MTGIIDGKAFAAELTARVANVVSSLESSHGLIPGLAVVLVGEDPASEVYVRNKGKQTVEVGMASFEHRLSDQTTESELLVLIDQLNSDPTVHGILVQLPLPAQINTHAVINAIDPDYPYGIYAKALYHGLKLDFLKSKEELLSIINKKEENLTQNFVDKESHEIT